MSESLLLDTHIAIWWFSGDIRLPSATQQLIRQSKCTLSVASIWEIAIKHRLGKLSVSPRDTITAAQHGGIFILPISAAHASATDELPMLHNDPFDRLLIAQARAEQLVLLTADEKLTAYGDGISLVG